MYGCFFFEKIEMPLSGMAEKIQVKEKSKYIIILSNAYYFSLRWNILTNMLQRARLVYDVASSTSISFDEDGDASFLSYSSAPYKPVTIFVVLIKHKLAQLFLFLFFQQQAADVKFLCQEPPT